jgi:hypothetical protein
LGVKWGDILRVPPKAVLVGLNKTVKIELGLWGNGGKKNG